MSSLEEEFFEKAKQVDLQLKKEEDAAMIQLGKCFAQRLKWRNRWPEEFEDFTFTLNKLQSVLKQLETSLEYSPGKNQHAVNIGCSSDRVLRVVSEVFPTRGDKHNMDLTFP